MEELLEVLRTTAEGLAEVDWNAVGNELIESVNEIGNTVSQSASTGYLDPEIMLTIGFEVFVVFAILAMCLVAFLAVAMVVLIFICLVVAIFLFITEYLIPAFALFRMAKNAGYKYPFFAFIPFMQTFLEFVLPKREFRLFFIRAPHDMRFLVAIAFLILTTFGVEVSGLFDFIPVIGPVLSVMAWLFVIACLIGGKWRKMHDIVRTYDTEKNALLISIIGIFVPLVHTIALLVYMNKTPEYGAGNYYKSVAEKVTEEKVPEEK